MEKHYTKFIDFGKGINDQVESPLSPANPLTYCMFPTLGSQFNHGSTSSGLLYDTNNLNCMTYMAERCKNSWDGFCEAYIELNVDNYWPNSAVIDTTAFELAQFFIKKRNTVGENLLRNACQRKFIHYQYQKPKVEPFDYNTANSPMIAIYSNSVVYPSSLQNLENPDHDVHVLKMMQNPKTCFDVLARIYLGVKRKEPATRFITPGSKLGQFLESYKELFESFLQIAIPRVPSFRPYSYYSPCEFSCGYSP